MENNAAKSENQKRYTFYHVIIRLRQAIAVLDSAYNPPRVDKNPNDNEINARTQMKLILLNALEMNYKEPKPLCF